MGRVLVPGTGSGPLLRLTHPLSFWGGVDPVRGVISDPRHPQHGREIAGRVLVVGSAVGSSSSSAIMLETMREGTSPAAILMGRADAILALGVVVGRELGYAPIPVVEVDPAALAGWPDGVAVEVGPGGGIRRASGS